MKDKNVLILAAMLFIALNVNSQNKDLTGAFGLTFGTNKVAVKDAMRKQVATFDSENDRILYYKNVKLGSKTADILACKFINSKLYEVIALFDPEREAFAQGIFDDLKEIIENKYGESEYFRNFQGIYDDGDGYEMQAIRTGNATIKSFWVFNNESVISLGLEPLSNRVVVKLVYQDGILAEEAVKQQESKNAEVF